ncbi:hypothetical protein B0T10DRAFT_447413 [Thelonectria olida]|uniref:Uncharacterized protein n=1 Tax=Thelonectria olida TaxID=1576542 RepID=A0A9P8VVC9_9HYPO|nr:hypothetical protein B0T10DRAFT_447413 [Thelonectria olida]
MDSRESSHPEGDGSIPRQATLSLAAYEVPEFMVRRLDGHIHPALNATPGSGAVYTPSQQWVAESGENEPPNLDDIYHTCLQAQTALILKANGLCIKRKIPLLDLTTSHSWTDVEESVLAACKSLETLAEKDKAVSPGFTGKMKKAFRSLCSNAGAGSTLANLVPTDSYCSVLCGGLKIIFRALEQTGHYRQEVYNALEELPFILNDNAILLELHNKDEELHRRVASLYTAMYKLMEVIVGWFLKPSLVTGTRIFVNPSGFSDRLKDGLAGVKIAAQRFAARVAIMSTQEQRALAQQNYSIMYMQGQTSQQMTQKLEKLSHSHLIVLDKLSEFLETHAEAERDHRERRAQQAMTSRIEAPPTSVEDILEKYLYEPTLVHADCENVLKLRHIPGYHFDEDLVCTVKRHPRFLSWLTLNESSLLFVDTRSEIHPCSLEMPIVNAEVFESLLNFSNEHASAKDGTSTHFISVAFFCSQHKDFARDVNGSPTELVMSLLLQLLDQYRDFDSSDLGQIMGGLDPNNIDSILSVFGTLVAQLQSNVIMLLIADDLREFTQPPERQRGTMKVVDRLRRLHHRGQYAATLKFLFATSTRAGFFDELFTEDEILRIWAPLPGLYGE